MDLSPQVRELARLAMAGDQAALTVLLTELDRPLRGRLERRLPAELRRSVDVDDLLQCVYSDVFAGVSNFRPQAEDSFDRWVATIALRRLRMEIRRQRTKKRGGGRRAIETVGAPGESAVTLLRLIEAGDGTPSRSAASRESAEKVAAALESLPSDYREAVRLVYLEGLSVAEAAERMGRTDRAIHNLCFKARQHLKELLGGESQFFSSTGDR